MKHILSHTTTSVTQTSRQSIGVTDDALIIPSGGPHLARHKAGPEDTDEESQCNQAGRCGDQTCHGSGDSAAKQDGDEDPSRSKLITHGSADESHEEAIIDVSMDFLVMQRQVLT